MPRPTAEELPRESLLELYRFMRQTRSLEERLVSLFRQGRIPGNVHRSLGQEACAVGSAYALEKGDLFSPLIRDLGAVLVRGGKTRDVLAQFLARGNSPTRGRDINIHYGWLSDEGSMICVTSMLGPVIPILVGAAMAERMRGRPTVALTWIGDGGTSTGVFHEGLNLACVQKAPFVLIVENNKYAYSTPTHRQTANPRFVDRARAYGCFGEAVDGNDVLAVYEVTRRAVERARNGAGPTLIEADTMRMAGHGEHDDRRYVPREQLDEWARRDPLARYERVLLARGVTRADLDAIAAAIDRELTEDIAFVEASPAPHPDTLLDGVWADRGAEPPLPALVRDWERKREAEK
jgi:pyruvate dehydrogenase E1 component alpha subunit/2-oxoisovalerate dehydrogenase E1 component alpha subunit